VTFVVHGSSVDLTLTNVLLEKSTYNLLLEKLAYNLLSVPTTTAKASECVLTNAPLRIRVDSTSRQPRTRASSGPF
jgi:hypothetical protein